MILAYLPVRVGSGGVEIAQRHPPQLVRALKMRQRALDSKLRLSVTVDGMLRMRFGDWRLLRLAVSCARRRQNEIPHRFGRHRLEDIERADHVVALVARRLVHRLADIEKGGEMH